LMVLLAVDDVAMALVVTAATDDVAEIVEPVGVLLTTLPVVKIVDDTATEVVATDDVAGRAEEGGVLAATLLFVVVLEINEDIATEDAAAEDVETDDVVTEDVAATVEGAGALVATLLFVRALETIEDVVAIEAAPEDVATEDTVAEPRATDVEVTADIVLFSAEAAVVDGVATEETALDVVAATTGIELLDAVRVEPADTEFVVIGEVGTEVELVDVAKPVEVDEEVVLIDTTEAVDATMLKVVVAVVIISDVAALTTAMLGDVEVATAELLNTTVELLGAAAMVTTAEDVLVVDITLNEVDVDVVAGFE
ncbi:hypothetical protein LTR16_004405, partial [Cryomyces antarcticus]